MGVIGHQRALRVVRKALKAQSTPEDLVAVLVRAGLLVDERAGIDSYRAYGVLTEDGTAVQYVAAGDVNEADARPYTRRTIEEPWVPES